MTWYAIAIEAGVDDRVFYSASAGPYELDVYPIEGPLHAWGATVSHTGDLPILWESPRLHATAWGAMAAARRALVDLVLGLLDEARA